MTTKEDFRKAYDAHHKATGDGYHAEQARTFCAMLEDPEVAEVHKETVRKAVKAHMQAEARGQRFGFEEVIKEYLEAKYGRAANENA